MRLVALIVTYNRLNYLKIALEKSKQFGFDEIFVVNNFSSDGTTEFLETITDPKIRICNLKTNSGGAGGFYEGLKLVKEKYHNGWVCLFDDDSYPETSREVVEAYLAPHSKDVGVVAASVLLPCGGISEMNRVGMNPFKTMSTLKTAIVKGRAGFHVNDSDYHGILKEIDTASFVGCFVNLESLRDSNILPRKEFFIYGDDVLFTYQLTACGYKNYFEPRIKFIHDCYSYDKNSVYTSLWKVYYLYRNGLEVYKHIAKELFPLAAARYIFIWLSRTRHYGVNKKKYLKITGMALRDWALNDYKKGLPEVIRAIEEM